MWRGNEDPFLAYHLAGKGVSSTVSMAYAAVAANFGSSSGVSCRAREEGGGACRFTLTSQRDFATNVDRLQTYRNTFALECDRQYVGRNGRVGHAEGGVLILVTTVCQGHCLRSRRANHPPGFATIQLPLPSTPC